MKSPRQSRRVIPQLVASVVAIALLGPGALSKLYANLANVNLVKHLSHVRPGAGPCDPGRTGSIDDDYEQETAGYYFRSLALGPANVSAAFGSGILALAQGNPAGAAQMLVKVLGVRPELGGSFLGLALYQAGNLEEAAQVWARAGAMPFLIHEGQVLRAAGCNEAAIVRFQQAASAFPEEIEPWLELGLTYREQFDNSSAVATFEQALSINADNVPANLGLAGVLLRDAARAGEARGYAQAALALLVQQEAPPEYDLGAAYVLLARAASYEGRPAQAILWYRKAIDLPNYPEGRSCIGIAAAYQSDGQSQAARPWIHCALSATGELARQGNVLQAKLDYGLILSIDPNNGQAALELERLEALGAD